MSYRSGGAGPDQYLLLHGLVATGDVFGRTPDRMAKHGRVVVPDILGFGKSLDDKRSDFGTAAHLRALDDLVDRELSDGPIHLGAHSMGSSIALRWAAANPARVASIVCLGPPIWPTPDAASAAIGAAGPMARAFVLDTRIAERTCRFNCNHRTLSGIISAAIAPRWPIPIARQASLHTWASYSQTLQEQVIDVPWADLLHSMDLAGVPVHLVWGQDDTVGDPNHARALAAGLSQVDVETIGGHDHSLPAARPDILESRLQGR